MANDCFKREGLGYHHHHHTVGSGSLFRAKGIALKNSPILSERMRMQQLLSGKTQRVTPSKLVSLVFLALGSLI